MLRSLNIKNYILINSLEIEFPAGLIIITGQTGAGKSILLGALSLLAGAKADASMISPGAETCVVEAEYSSDSEALKELFEQEDLDFCDGNITIRRVVSSNGRSRCFVNDCPVQVSILQRIAASLIDIHSQHASLALAKSEFQMSALDLFAGSSSLLLECRSAWRDVQRLQAELNTLREKLVRARADSEYNEAQFQQLDAAKLQEGELESLEEEHKSLSNAEQIKENVEWALEYLCSREDGLGVVSALKDSAKRLAQIQAVFPSVGELTERLESIRIEAEDVQSELERITDRIDMSPQRLETVEQRMSLLYGLLKKHSCSSIEDLIALRESFGDLLSDNSALEERIADCEKELQASQQQYDRISGELTQKRKAAAPKLSEEITRDLHFLELERSRLEIVVEPCEAGANGKDKISFLFAANGQKSAELSKVASGGELSRIMLCIKAMMARFTNMPTMIFDEIDTGVSGSTADKMGEMVCNMGRDMQVFSITHLPQVAAKGDAHYLVSKSVSGNETISKLTRIEGSDRVQEIARLLSGSTITPEALANAEVLLKR